RDLPAGDPARHAADRAEAGSTRERHDRGEDGPVTELVTELRDDTLSFPATLPVLPLKETVVFPDSMTPLAIGQERSIKLVEEAVSGDRAIALVTVRNPDADPPAWEDLYDVGTAAVIQDRKSVV